MFVSYRQFSLDPTAAIHQLYDDMESVGVDLTEIKKLSNVDIVHYLGARWKTLHQEKFGMVDPYLKRINRFKFLSPRAINLWQAITDDEGVTASCINCLDAKMLQPTAWANEQIQKRQATEAYAHFIDEVTEESLRKTKVLAASILQVRLSLHKVWSIGSCYELGFALYSLTLQEIWSRLCGGIRSRRRTSSSLSSKDGLCTVS